MAELKLTPQTLRKILNDNGFQRPGEKNVPMIHNKICYGYQTSSTGITMKVYIKNELIGIWAETNDSYGDIKKIEEILNGMGYVAEAENKRCWVKLPKETN